MKALKVVTHPYILLLSFLFILISGEHLGGFYALYLLLALPHGGIHAVLGVVGIVMLLVNHQLNKQGKVQGVRISNIIAAIFLAVSIILFFVNDKQRYNYNTFDQPVPVTTLSLFSVLFLLFIIKNAIPFIGRDKRIESKISF